MKRYYSPSSYTSKQIPSSDLLTQTVRPSINIRSSTNLHLGTKTEVKKKVGRYYYLETEQIGKGYTSCVYKAYSAQDINLSIPRQTYAIKVMPLNTVNTSSLELLENQIQILKLVDHPNIIKCYDIYKSKTHCYIITEFCPEGCLTDFINKNKSTMDRKINLSQEKIYDITQQIIEGLKYLFQKGIIHRDIKPANILKGKNGWKIADFGFAIFSDKEIKSKFNVGTPLYMPIESLKQNLYSPQSDIFSIGIILYQLSTGKTPWQSKSEKQLIRKMQLIPLESTSGKNKIQCQLFKLIQKLCQLRTRNRMNQRQFMNLNIKKFIKEQEQQSQNKIEKHDLSKQLKSIKSEIQFQRRLKPIKSMDHFAFMNQKQKFIDKNDKFTYKNTILEQEKIDKKELYKNPSLLLLNNENYQTQDHTLKSYGSKQEIYSSLRYKYLDIPSSIRPSLCLKKDTAVNMKKYIPRASELLNVKSSTRLNTKRQIKNQDRTRCTEDKESENSINPQSEDVKYTKEQLKYIDQVSHILLNQIHFCRFLFYLYKNSLYILLGKNSQDKLAVLIFQMIFSTLDDLKSLQLSTQRLRNKSIPVYFKDKHFRTYLKSEKHQLMRKTIKQYREKYERQHALLKIKLGQNIFDEIEMEQKKDSLGIKRQQNQEGNLIFVQNELKGFLKEFDHNLHLTIDTISNSQRSISSPRHGNRNGFISANIQGIKNLYQFYKLTTLMVETEKDMLKFQKKSKIKVTTDYAKNSEYSYDELRKIRDLIRSL